MKLVANPADDTRYLACLNECFAGWGNQAVFDWVFRRRVGEHASDLMIVEDDDGAWIAGSGVSYRPLALPGGGVATVGIMTGSWTLPAARGKGCFTRIIDESIAMVREKRGALLLAYVTETNASYRRLAASGAGLFSTRYVFTNEATPVAPPVETHEVAPTPALVAELAARAHALAAGCVHVRYTGDEWAHQLVHRAEPTTIVEVPGAGHAVVETHGEFDRLQAVLPLDRERYTTVVRALLARAQARRQKLFVFVSDAARGDALTADCGLGSAKGFVTVNVADRAALAALAPIDASITSDDATALADPALPTNLGRLWLQSGDRM